MAATGKVKQFRRMEVQMRNLHIDGTTVTATGTELNQLAGVVPALTTTAQTIGGIKTFSSMFRIPVGANVAAAGSDQAGAAALVEGAQVVTGANGSLGVRLPVAAVGAIVIIKGTTAGVLKVYPDTGAGINAVGTDTAMSLASGVIPALFWKHTATQWYTLPLLPS